MTYVAIGLGALLIAQYVYANHRWDKLRADFAKREDELLNRIQAPQLAVGRSMEPHTEKLYLSDSDITGDLEWDRFVTGDE